MAELILSGSGLFFGITIGVAIMLFWLKCARHR